MKIKNQIRCKYCKGLLFENVDNRGEVIIRCRKCKRFLSVAIDEDGNVSMNEVRKNEGLKTI